MEVVSAKPRLRLLLDHLGAIRDTRQSWKVAYPLREVLFLVVCGTIADCDDYEEIVDWGEANLSFLRDFCEFHHGTPCADWLRTIMNRIDPALFRACFSDWVAACWPQAPDLVAMDGKLRAAAMIIGTLRRPCIWCPPSPQTPAWCSVRKPCSRNPTKSPPSRRSSSVSNSRGPWSPSTPWDVTQTSPETFSRPRPTICWPSRITSPPCTPISEAISHSPRRRDRTP